MPILPVLAVLLGVSGLSIFALAFDPRPGSGRPPTIILLTVGSIVLMVSGWLLCLAVLPVK